MKKKSSYGWLFAICFIMMFLLGGGFAFAILRLPIFNDNSSGNNDIHYNSCSNCMSGTTVVENGGIKESVKKVYDSVVMVKIYKNKTTLGSGSGFVYKKDSKYGYIMTNYHVIEKAETVKIRTVADDEVDGKVLGGDKFMDIAIVRIPADKVVAVAKIGSTENLQLGETVFAIGTPVGEEYFNTVTSGIVSGLNRKVTVSVESTGDWVQEVLQIDVAINPGNSGGPLFNFNGEVIGVNSMKLVNSDIEGMGFTIKIEDAMKHVEEFEKGESLKRPYLGVSYIDATETAALKYYGIRIDNSITEGVVVASVENGSAADKAGLQKADVILKLNDDKVSSNAYLRYLLYKYNIGDTIKITYNRSGKEYTTSVKLTEKSN